ncbi:MAG: family 78 glycoside hydrolase catalytic domain, partial [Sulfobacillus sp.]
MEIGSLTCNYLQEPLGVESPHPRLSWMLQSEQRAQMQTAYRILAGTDRRMLEADEGDLWDTGEVASDQSIHVVYRGRFLASRQSVFWKVRVWDKDGRASEWSDIASFEMGLLEENDWLAEWIGHPGGGTDVDRAVPAPLFRKSIEISREVSAARVYVSGLGYYELYINGAKIGDEVLAPGFTRYDRTVLYQTFDVTEVLNQGQNVFGIILGNGWYNCFTTVVWDFDKAAWRDQPKFILQAHITFADGEEQIVVSDADWKSAESPIVFDGLRNGEFYDARREKRGWNQPGYDDHSWIRANTVKSPEGVRRSQQMAPIKVRQTIRPVCLEEVSPGTWVYDLGQNISGWAQIRVSGPAGTGITLRYAEEL